MKTHHDNTAVARIEKRIAADECVILDGAIATELQRRGAHGFQLSDDAHWGFDALHESPAAVAQVHRAYLAAGADILTTNTYSILEAPAYIGRGDRGGDLDDDPAHWFDMARAAIALPRRTIAQAGRAGEVAVAFSIGGDVETDAHMTTVDLLLRLFERDAPDLVLFETLSLLDDNLTLAAIDKFIAAGLPVWVSFRRCRQGLCGIHGQLWGGPEGDRFGRLARRLEAAGAGALLINCLPTARIKGTLAWLRDFTDLPLGVYPNVGRYVESGWKFADAGPEEFAAQALTWRAEGAQIIGGCCGVGPAEIEMLARRLTGVPRGDSRPSQATDAESPTMQESPPWTDDAGRELFPLPLPAIVVDPGVFMPTQGSYLIWKYLFNGRVGEGKRCLDIGCGVGILAIQLALNGAKSVTAVDIQQAAIANTMTNAYRNGVASNITGVAEDLYSFTPAERFDLIVASLYQMPTDPRGQAGGHRDVDYWGRNLLDHLIAQLPAYLAPDGVAYLMQISILGARRTRRLLAQHGYKARVVDFNLYQFNPVFHRHLDQINRVEELSDAYHFTFGADEHATVMYLLEVTAADSGA